ncbi:hypothetical protein KR76_00078 [Pimelobacter simplex]|uniref:Uncharacterized protein n=1 Tax=Nocardioides simplex TaxID=2045 RepID=A0A0C5WYA4_NOCSI|nr:hypothetical protein KR76_00078 [Pimelobacter simplex]
MDDEKPPKNLAETPCDEVVDGRRTSPTHSSGRAGSAGRRRSSRPSRDLRVGARRPLTGTPAARAG